MNTGSVSTISGDDHLWVVQGVPWFSNGVQDLEGLLASPQKFIEAHGLTYRDELGDIQPVKITDHYFAVLRKSAISSTGFNEVQGIHGTGMLTIRAEFGSFANPGLIGNGPTIAPVNSVIELTLVTSSKRAYLHYQLGDNKSTVARHTLSYITNRFGMSMLVEQAFQVPNNGTLQQIDADGVRTDIPGPMPQLDLTFADGYEIYYEGTTNYVVTCNVDIGNYYIDENGIIHIIIDGTIIKSY